MNPDRRTDARRTDARRQARRRQGRFARWDPGISLTSLAEVLGAKDAKELVVGLAGRMLVVPLPEERVQVLVDFVTGKDGSDKLDLDNLHEGRAEVKLRKLVHLIMSTPEFQLS